MSDNVLYVNDLMTSAFAGKINGDVSVNLISSLIKANVKGKNLDVADTLLSAAAMKDTLSGTMDFTADISLKGATYQEQMESLLGEVTFNMKDGDLGPFGKLENLIMAENIRDNAFFQSTIGSILNSLLSFDTAHYNTLSGKLTFKDGVVGKQGVTRTVKKAFMTSFEEWNKTIPSFKEDYVLVILSASKDEEKINKAKEILDIINPGMEIIFRNLSLNVTAHTGPGVIGLGIMKKY
jgi:hypothetical protein